MSAFDIIVSGDGSRVLCCLLEEALGVVEPTGRPPRPWAQPKYRLTPGFERWLNDHCEFQICVDIGTYELNMEFPSVEAAMAFKLVWL